jgi:hypothetical protein
MDRLLRKAVLAELNAGRGKRVAMGNLLAAVRRQPLGPLSDFELRDRLLAVLRGLDADGRIRLPKTSRCWDRQTGLPRFVTAVRPEAAAQTRARRETLDELRHATAWEPIRMVAFAHTLKDIGELERARQVNQYLLSREPDTVPIPHRERALAVFGDEKALDRAVRHGLFGGRISLSDLDCFYCAEPLPFRPFSLDPRETQGKPLLVIENACTYWSCCRANETLHRYAAVVYGQGFQACAAERASDGLSGIEAQVAADGIHYFGDLDPTGIAIPMRINGYRLEKAVSPLRAERRLYQALLEKNLPAPYARSQEKDHDPALAREWLGAHLAARYLETAHRLRFPQEGLTAADIASALGPGGRALP